MIGWQDSKKAGSRMTEQQAAGRTDDRMGRTAGRKKGKTVGRQGSRTADSRTRGRNMTANGRT